MREAAMGPVVTCGMIPSDVIVSGFKIGRCGDCRFWNGNGGRVAPCFKIKGQNGRYYDIPIAGAGFQADAPDHNGPFLMTGPDFGCLLFEQGKVRWWGDDGSDTPPAIPPNVVS